MDEVQRDNLLGAYVLAVADRLHRATEETAGHSGASASALVTIAHFPHQNVEFLRRAIGLSHSATVRVVDRLVVQRLVRRRPAGRGPGVSLSVTATGRRRAGRILDARRRVLAEALPPLTADEASQLSAILHRALGHLADAPGTTICRLCDQTRCRGRDCPVENRQVGLGVPPPPPARIDI